MKKVLCCLLILIIFAALTGCKRYESSEISLHDVYLDATFELTDQQEKELLKLLNKAKWEYSITKTAYDYEFVLDDGRNLRYSSFAGLFNDKEGNRHMELTKKQKKYVDSLIMELSKVQIEASDMKLNQDSTKQCVNVTKEQMQDIVNIWNASDWDLDYYGGRYDYWFVLETEQFILYDTESGVFHYVGRTMTVSNEQRQQINAFIEQLFAE